VSAMPGYNSLSAKTFTDFLLMFCVFFFIYIQIHCVFCVRLLVYVECVLVLVFGA